MDTITPNYYAAGNFKVEYIVTGSGFSALPSNVIAVSSNDNDNPLVGRYQTNPDIYAVMIERTDTMVRFAANSNLGHSALYLGAIVSNDREHIFYLNTSRPLP